MPCVSDYCICIPHGTEDKKMTHNADCIYILVTEDCWWCYTDAVPPCFPNGFLPNGRYTMGTVKGPYMPTAGGKVNFNSSLANDCNSSLPEEGERIPPHTITVS